MASANRPDFELRELNSLSNLTLVGDCERWIYHMPLGAFPVSEHWIGIQTSMWCVPKIDLARLCS